MEPISIDKIISWSGGTCIRKGTSEKISAVSTDSRLECKNALFVPLKGENFDGNDFIKNAVQKGAIAYLTEKNSNTDSVPQNVTCIKVKNTLTAFQKIASCYRRLFNAKVVAVTGSNGKTTTKEYIRSVLSSRLNTIATEGTKNNHIGVPETVFMMDYNTHVAVFEIGMSGAGEIDNLAQIINPAVGIITNVSYVHTEFFKSLQEVAEAKSELLANLPSEGCAILNADDQYFEFFIKKNCSKFISFGIQKKADLQADSIKHRENELEFNVYGFGSYSRCCLKTTGGHNVYNALAAIATGYLFDIPLKQSCESLLSANLPQMRFEIENIGNIKIINDAYNANPVSTIFSIDAFEQIKVSGKKIIVLGDMLELGWYSKTGHEKVGRHVAESAPDFLITVGKLALDIALSAKKKGFKGQIMNAPNAEEAGNILSEIVEDGDAVLIKGSRAMKLENALNRLKKNRITGFV